MRSTSYVFWCRRVSTEKWIGDCCQPSTVAVCCALERASLTMYYGEDDIVLGLRRLCESVPGFVLEFVDGRMPAADERAFALRLVEIAELLVDHANAKAVVIVEGQVVGSRLELLGDGPR